MGTTSFEIEVRAPFRLDLTVWALRRRPHNTVDAWDGATYRRTFLAGGEPVHVLVREVAGGTPGPVRLGVVARRRGEAPSDAAAAEVRSTVERLLGLDVDLTGFYELAASDERLAELSRRFFGLRPPRFASAFEALVNAVACQQLSLDVGIHLLDRLAEVYGPKVALCGASPGFPGPEDLAEAEPTDLRRLGFSQAKARTVIEIARRTVSGALDLDTLAHADVSQVIATLVLLSGIGRWSAEYVALRGLGHLGVLPGDDVGARNNLRRHFELAEPAGYDDVAALTKSWWPYGGVVYFHLLIDGLARAGHLDVAADQHGAARTSPLQRGAGE